MSDTNSKEAGPLDLNESFRHWDSLSWQLPSVGMAIAAGVIVAADEVADAGSQTAWVIDVRVIQGLMLLLGGVLLSALTLGLLKYREFQSATLPRKLPSPPFARPPKAGRYLQLAMFLMSGVVVGLGVMQLFSCWCSLVCCAAISVVAWIVAEVYLHGEVTTINKKFGVKIDKNTVLEEPSP